MSDFIEVYENVLSREACAALIRRFEASGHAVPGQVGGGVMPELKDSRDLTISTRQDWQDACNQLNQAVFGGLLKYFRTYSYALIAPLMVQHLDPATQQPRPLRADDFASLPDAQLGHMLQSVFRPGNINIQRYTAGSGGYPYWHCELYPKDTNCEPLHRHLLWTIYLNDGFDEGETEFFYQQRKIVPKTGSLLLAPTAFTHTHRGNRPQRGDKYIATSWVLFNRAEQLFGKR